MTKKEVLLIKDILGERILKKSKWETISRNTWKPEVGDKIQGKLVSISKYEGDFVIKIYLLLKDDGKKIKILGSTYLDELMDEINPNDYIRITYNGFKKTHNGYDMKIFNVERRISDENQGRILEGTGK